MTSRIYVRGDIAQPTRCKVFDADTHMELTDIVFMDITIAAMGSTEASLTQRGTNGTTTVDVVPDPYPSGKGRPGDFHLTLNVEPDHILGGTSYHARVTPHGEVTRNVKKVLSDLELNNAIDPKRRSEDVATSVLQDVMDSVIEDLVKQHPIPSGGVAGAVRMNNASQAPTGTVTHRPTTGLFPPAKDYEYLSPYSPSPEATFPVKKCPECNGKGEVELFNGTVPCSTCGPGDTTTVRFGDVTMVVAKPDRDQMDKVAKKIADYWDGAAHAHPYEPINCRCDLSYVEEKNFGVTSAEFISDKVFPRECVEKEKSECPDCGGTGSVELFTSVEDCSTCCD